MPKQNIGQFWLWVTRPEHYLDRNGQERANLNPSSRPKRQWWTCHEDTTEGDLVLLWRTSPKRDIGYLIRAETEALPVPRSKQPENTNWPFACNYRVLYKFAEPIKIAELHNHPGFRDWIAYRSNFQRMVFEIPLKHWTLLNARLIEKNPGYYELLESLGPFPKFQALLDKSRRQIETTGGIPHDVFWREMAEEKRQNAGETKPSSARTRHR